MNFPLRLNVDLKKFVHLKFYFYQSPVKGNIVCTIFLSSTVQLMNLLIFKIFLAFTYSLIFSLSKPP